MKKTHLPLLLLTLGVAVYPLYAQAGWLDRAKTLMNAETGQRAVELLGNKKQAAAHLNSAEITSGLKEALRVSSARVVSRVGQADGFYKDPNIKIPLSGTLQRVDSALSSIGMGAMTDDLKLRINRAAESATPKAKALFVQAIQQMSIQDARSILTGPDKAATQYLRKAMGPELLKEIQPLIGAALSEAGAIKSYESAIGQYTKIPFMPDVKANLNKYVGQKTLDGVFYYVAQEEKAIRENPAARTTALLKKVFSATNR